MRANKRFQPTASLAALASRRLKRGPLGGQPNALLQGNVMSLVVVSLPSRARMVYSMSVARMSALLASLLILSSSGCGLFPPAEESSTGWFGIQVPLATWDVDTAESDPVRLGMIAHRSLAGCRVTIMTQDPFYLAGYPAGWEGAWEESRMSMLNVVRVTVRDEANTPRLIYYEIYDGTGSRNFYRLAYFEVEWGEDMEQCTEAFEELLMGVDPRSFPELPVAQG